MNIHQYAVRLPAALAIATLFAACGGGGGNPSNVPGKVDTPTPTPTPTPMPTPGDGKPDGCKAYIVADKTVAAGKAGGASVLSCGGPLADVSWSQVSGPAVTLQAARAPTVSFETREKGVIVLRADVTLADGARLALTTEVTVSDAPAGSFINLRADHSVRPGVQTSVRAWPTLAEGDSVASIVWTQVGGPAVTMDTDNRQLLMFKAPASGTDVALRFRATMTTSGGVKDSDEVLISLDQQVAGNADSLFDAPTARVHAYRQAGAYAGVLARCTYDVKVYYATSANNTLCRAQELPPLQTEAGVGVVPSVAQIMGRVLVSHDFLGANFEQFLLTQDPDSDFRRLLASTSAIVIGSHVRPSFYSAGTGAIYLDANNLWLTAEQRDVVTEVPDYRSAFDDELNFIPLGRSVKNNEYARRSYPSTTRMTRTTDDLMFDLGRLLYHELAHANDFLPSVNRAINPQRSIWENIAERVGGRTLPSDALASQYPLQSAEMLGMGQVLYQGQTATPVQKAYTAAEVGSFFGADRASDDYAYSIYKTDSSREDLAMLFEEFMMSYRHNVRYDVAYANQTTGSDLVIGWGQRGRIGEAAIKPRIKLVLQRIAPWIDASAVDRLPAPVMMKPGASWEANLVLNPSSMAKQSALRVESADERAARLKGDIKQRERHGKMTP
ncbi:hypothetical protein [Massilia aquatica]|uniref:hypothetical protein n=1 Tax=Massilia aquatica TaxID=2609000 RepID=UPI0014218A3D|nr:hypothetical protein [Massilia aquatica]